MDNAHDRDKALQSIADMIARSETAQAKFAPGTSQHTLQSNRLHALCVAAALIRWKATGCEGTIAYTKEDQEKARAPIRSLISKSEKARQKLSPGTWQYNMLTDNLEALHLAESLLPKLLERDTGEGIRKAMPQDAAAIKAIARRVIRHNYAPFLGEEAANAFIESGMSDKEIDDNLGDCTVALFSGDIVGFAITKDDLLHLLMIDVPFQGRGFGGLLLLHVENELFRKYATLRLQTFQENAHAVRFYLRKGWRITGEEFMEAMNQTMLFFEKTTI